MQPEFYRIADAITYTMEFYKIDKIKEYIKVFANKDQNSRSKIEWYDLMFVLHNRMEDEILQTINTCNHNTIAYLFNTLKEWLTDERILRVNSLLIIPEIDQYNKITLAEFESKVVLQVEHFQATPEFSQYKHLQEYITDKPDRTLQLIFGNNFNQSRKVINYKYYCIDESPELIDTMYVDDYIQLLDKLVTNLRNILSKYIGMYDKGEIKAFDTISVIHHSDQLNQPILNLPQPENKKLKLNLTVEQVALLFKLLKDNNYILARYATDVQRFIRANITTAGTEDEISEKYLANVYSSPDRKTADFLRDVLRKLITDLGNI